MIELIRKWYYPQTTIGELFIDGSFFCYTLEDTVRPDWIKVKGHTAIPCGEYSVWCTHSPRFNRVLPELMDVPMFKGVRIHRGNKHEHTEGCILVGFKMDKNKIYESTQAEEKIVQLITGVQTIKIKNMDNYLDL